MKKVIVLTFILNLFSTSALIGQTPFQKGNTQLDIGFVMPISKLHYYAGGNYSFNSNISMGLEISRFKERIPVYSFSWYGIREDYDTKYFSHLSMLSCKLNYHFVNLLKMPERWDLYAGLHAGWYYIIYDAYYVNSDDFFGGGQIGTRYFLSDYVSINLEAMFVYVYPLIKCGITVAL
jgi:outer membrane immunogenic protein